MTNKLSRLGLAKLEHCKKILNTWSLPADSETGGGFRELLDHNLHLYRELVKKLSTDIWRHLKERFPWIYHHPTIGIESRASASSAYIGLLLYRAIVSHMRREGKEELDETLDIYIILLYIGSDYILDDSSISNEVKQELVYQVGLVESSEHVETIDTSQIKDHRVEALIKLLLELLTLEPACKEGVFAAWKSEKESEKQTVLTSFDKLWDLSADKGHKTIYMACTVINEGQTLPFCQSLGSVTQHLDDLMDHKTDLAEGINTAVTVSMNSSIGLDYYLYKILQEIESLDNRMYVIKIFFIQAVCSCGYHNPSTSTEMKDLLGYYLLDKKICDFEGFVKMIVGTSL